MSMVTASLARRAGLRVTPYQGPSLSFGTSAPVFAQGAASFSVQPQGMKSPRRLEEVVVVDDAALPADQQLLLGVGALKTLRAVPDVSERVVYWKQEDELYPTEHTVREPLHTG